MMQYTHSMCMYHVCSSTALTAECYHLQSGVQARHHSCSWSRHLCQWGACAHAHARTHTHTHTQCTYTMTLCIVGSCWSSLEQFIPEVLCVLSSPYLGGGQVCFWPSRQQLSAVACASHRLRRPQTDHHCDSICWDNCNYHWDYSGRHGHCCHSDEVSIQTSHTPASHQ